MRQSILGGDSNSKRRIPPWPWPRRPRPSFLIMCPGMGIAIVQNQLLTRSRRPLCITTIPIPQRRRSRRHIL